MAKQHDDGDGAVMTTASGTVMGDVEWHDSVVHSMETAKTTHGMTMMAAMVMEAMTLAMMQ